MDEKYFYKMILMRSSKLVINSFDCKIIVDKIILSYNINEFRFSKQFRFEK